ncbi:hypothetical protein FHW84_002561 [Dyella sp. SG562]|uniref:hypothetical protein n=1 Tax=Dyella sp. SG562 TaxID=2587017 RepID=UPI001421F01F|nr:hypothetical protein [Dyella sp. SG562]NII73976.1 hypothetical protein [Dyella sp. SG562]
MAENESLDFGHRNRWFRSRKILQDPLSTLDQFIHNAAEDCREAVRRLPLALRKGPALLALVKALETGSIVALQEVVATFTEKRIASITLSALRSSPSADAKDLAGAAAESIISTLIDQITARAKREQRFCSVSEQAELRKSLRQEFSVNIPALSDTLETSLRGDPVRRIRKPFPSVRMAPKDVARMSLIISPPQADQPHAR